MHLFDPKGVIKKFDTPEQILEEFFHLRYDLFEKRKKLKLNNLEMDLLKLENKVRFILGVVNGEIIVSNRKRDGLLTKLRDKGFTPFPKKAEVDKEAAVDGSDDNVEDEENSGVKGVQAGEYEYLLSMAIGTLTLEKVKQLCADRDRLNGEVNELKRTTPKCLWMKDLDALEKELDGEDKNAAEYEEVRLTQKNQAMGKGGLKVSKQVPKNPRKNNKRPTNMASVSAAMETSSSSAIETDAVPKVPKPKGRGGSKNAQAQKSKGLEDDDEDDNIMKELKDQIAAYNLSASSDHSENMESEDSAVPARKNEPSKRAVAQKKPPLSSVMEISGDEDENEDMSDDDFDLEVVPEIGKKRVARKPAANTKRAVATKAPVPAKKRGQTSTLGQGLSTLGQGLITEILKPADNVGVLPEKKMRKIRVSPSNKKSGSILGRNGMGITENLSTGNEETTGSITLIADEMSELALAQRARPQRVNRAKAKYVVSDSESDQISDDSDFDDEASVSE